MRSPQLAVLSTAIALAGCSTIADVAVEKPVVPRTESECLIRDGNWTQLGPSFPDKPKICDLKTTDAGNACTDSRQCQGSCLAPADTSQGTRTIGACSRYVAIFGNVILVSDGKAERLNVE